MQQFVGQYNEINNGLNARLEDVEVRFAAQGEALMGSVDNCAAVLQSSMNIMQAANNYHLQVQCAHFSHLIRVTQDHARVLRVHARELWGNDRIHGENGRAHWRLGMAQMGHQRSGQADPVVQMAHEQAIHDRNVELDALRQMVARQETQIAQKNREACSLDGLFNRQVNVIEDLHKTIDDKQETIERLNDDLDEWTQEVDEQDIMIKSRNAEIRRLQNRTQELRNDLTNAEAISMRRLKERNDRIHELEIQLQAARNAANPNGL